MKPLDSFRAILDAREERTRRRLDFAKRYGRAILTVTMNIPGPDKSPERYTHAFRTFVSAFAAFWSEIDSGIRHLGVIEGMAGTEAHFATRIDAADAKRRAVGFESAHPWGRCFDIDVLDPEGIPVSRQGLGLPERSCLCCPLPARLCARDRTHPLADLLDAIDRVLALPPER